MPLSLKQIDEHEEALRQEITEREHLLAAYQLIRAEREKALGLPGRVLPAALTVSSPATPAESPSPEPAAAPVVPESNRQLLALSTGHGGTGRAVNWILRRMTAEFTVHDLAAVLRCEGVPIEVAKLSVVLNRMKIDETIIEVSRGGGQRPSVFRARSSNAVPPAEVFVEDVGSSSAATPALASTP